MREALASLIASNLKLKKMEPYIKKFETEKNNYIYDVNTNQFLRVDKIVYEIIDYIYNLAPEQLFEKFKNKYEEKLLEKAIDGILLNMKNSNLFSLSRPKRLGFPLPNEEILRKLETEIHQLTLCVTEQCNLRCTYCTYSGNFPYQRTHTLNSMNFDIARKAIDFFLIHSMNNENPAVSFYGGEPLLNFNLIKRCVNYVKKKNEKKNISFHITTNGTILSNEMLKFFVENNFHLMISLDGPQKIHDRYRKFINEGGTFEKIIKNLNKIYGFYPQYYKSNISFNMVLTPPYNLLEINKFFENFRYFKDNKNIRASFAYLNGSNLFHDEIRESKKYLFSQLEKLKNDYINNIVSGQPDKSIFVKALFERDILYIYKRGIFNRLEEEHRPNGICIPGLRKVFIDINGNFYICEKTDDFQSIGNIENGFDYKKIFELINSYIEISTSDCINCWAIRLCKLCFIYANENKNLSLEKKRKKCESFKDGLIEDLITYCQILENNPKALDFMKNIVII